MSAAEVLTLAISTFHGQEDNQPVAKSLSWPQLVKTLTRHRERDEKDGPAWSPASFQPGSTRLKVNVQHVSAAVADLDSGVAYGDLKDWLAGYEWVAHSTHSFTPENGKFRVILPLAQPVPASDWADIWQRLNAHVFNNLNDPETKDAGRIYFLPSCPPAALRFAEHHAGELLDPYILPAVTNSNGSKPMPAPAIDGLIAEARNSTLASFAGTMRRRGMSRQEIEAALRVVNDDRCDPPLKDTVVQKIAASISRYEPASQTRRPSQATELVSLASDATLFHTSDGQSFAGITVGDHQETWPLKSKTLRQWLARRFFELKGSVPNAQSVQDALAVLEGQAAFSGPELSVFTRIAKNAGAVYVDLVNSTWQAVEITESGWRIIENPPVRFRRSRGMLALPPPVPGGSLDDLRPFINLANESDWRLFVGWLLAALCPAGPRPVLEISGEQGAAKSTSALVARALIDPNSAPLRQAPKDARDLMIAATNSWIVSLDNLSHLPDWLSDCICRLATGGGFSTRELYTDGEEIIFSAQRPVILNGIESLIHRGDLLDRALILNSPAIPEERRRPEADFWRDFEQVRPRVLGTLCAAVSMALRNLPHTTLPNLPRMADFALWLTAAEPALNWPSGAFLKAYTGNVADANELSLEASPVAAAVIALASAGGWQGTTSELLRKVSGDDASTNQHGWPKNARTLGGQLRRLAPNLRRIGVVVEFGRTNSQRWVAIRKSRDSCVTIVTEPIFASQGGESGDATGGDGDATSVTVTQPGESASPQITCKSAENDDGDVGDAKIPTLSPGVWGEV